MFACFFLYYLTGAEYCYQTTTSKVDMRRNSFSADRKNLFLAHVFQNLVNFFALYQNLIVAYQFTQVCLRKMLHQRISGLLMFG